MQTHEKKDNTLKIALFEIAILCVFIVSVLVMESIKNKEKEAASQEVTLCAEENGLEDVTVELRKFSYDTSQWYYADITCSNFGDFNPYEMLSICKSIKGGIPLLKVGKLFVELGDIYSGEDVYRIFLGADCSVRKNGKTIFEGYDSSYKSNSQDSVDSSLNSSGNMAESTNSDKDSYGHTKYDAITIAEKEVKAKLKSPSTAKFSSFSEISVTRSGNTWRVTGWVDAQNGFGATLRNSYTVKIEFASSDTYTVKECTVS